MCKTPGVRSIACIGVSALCFIGAPLPTRSGAQTTTGPQATPAHSASQKGDEPKTRLEQFQARSGGVVIKGFTDVGSLSGRLGGVVQVTSTEFTDATSGAKQFGIAIEVKETGRFERSSRSYIDLDEIDSLLKGIDYIGSVEKTVTKLANFEATYRSRGDFRVTRFSSNVGRSGTMLAVESGLVAATRVFLDEKDLPKLREILEKAYRTLQAVK
jgi:hypothetical protein